VFYDGTLDAATYRAWLLDNGIRFVALPDAPLDSSATAEAALLDGHLPYLKPVWATAHWRVWEVLGSTGMTGDTQTIVTAIDGDIVDLTVLAPGRHLVRVRHGEHLAVISGTARVERDASGWTAVTTDQPGRVVLDSTWRSHGPSSNRG
jgi:hypothetical protein